MQFLYRVQPTRTAMLEDGGTPQEQDAVSRHFAYLQALMAQGVLILAGRTLNTGDTSFGIIIFNAESQAAAQAVMEGDPAVREGVMRADLFPYRVALLAAENAV